MKNLKETSDITTSIEENDGKLFYKENGEVQSNKGLVKVENNLYYVMEDGTVARDTDVELVKEKANSIVPEGIYHFDKDGKIIIPDDTVQ